MTPSNRLLAVSAAVVVAVAAFGFCSALAAPAPGAVNASPSLYVLYTSFGDDSGWRVRKYDADGSNVLLPRKFNYLWSITAINETALVLNDGMAFAVVDLSFLSSTEGSIPWVQTQGGASAVGVSPWVNSIIYSGFNGPTAVHVYDIASGTSSPLGTIGQFQAGSENGWGINGLAYVPGSKSGPILARWSAGGGPDGIQNDVLASYTTSSQYMSRVWFATNSDGRLRATSHGVFFVASTDNAQVVFLATAAPSAAVVWSVENQNLPNELQFSDIQVVEPAVGSTATLYLSTNQGGYCAIYAAQADLSNLGMSTRPAWKCVVKDFGISGSGFNVFSMIAV